MIALDSNILIGAVGLTAYAHTQIVNWLDSNTAPVCCTGTNIAETLRVITHPKIFEKPMSLPSALEDLQEVINEYSISVLSEDPNWWKALDENFSSSSIIRGNDIHDARIALCLKHHGVKEILTLDADFMKYRFLKVLTP